MVHSFSNPFCAAQGAWGRLTKLISGIRCDTRRRRRPIRASYDRSLRLHDALELERLRFMRERRRELRYLRDGLAPGSSGENSIKHLGGGTPIPSTYPTGNLARLQTSPGSVGKFRPTTFEEVFKQHFPNAGQRAPPAAPTDERKLSMPQLRTEELEIAFMETGTQHGKAVLLLHGWPDDASTWEAVIERLKDRKFRFVIPYLRGFGPSRFRNDHAPRTANGGILAMDAIALMNGLGIERFSVVGHDWGSHIAECLAIGWPERVERIALLSSTPRMGGLQTPPFKQAQLYWYQWFMATKRGAEAIDKDRAGYARLQWENWAPEGWFDEATFGKVSKSFDNPDWLEVTLHSYRVRWE